MIKRLKSLGLAVIFSLFLSSAWAVVSDNYAPTKDLANGVTTEFTFNWPALSTDYIEVWQEDETTAVQTEITTGFTVAENAAETGGTVTFITPPDDVYIIIKRVTPLSQATSYGTSRGFQASVVENSFDKLTAITQEREEEASRSLTYPLGTSTDISAELPTPSVARAGLTIKVNEDGDGWSISDYDPDQQITLATAQAVLAQGYASTAQANAALTAADVVSTNADVVSTNADVVTCNALVASADLPTISGGDSGKILVVNGGETGYELTALQALINNIVYPVGSVVTLGVATNPATLLGVGTWTAIEGKVIVGKASAGTFDTLDATGGAETVTLTSAQSGVPAHTHNLSGVAGDGPSATGQTHLQGATTDTSNTGTTDASSAANASEAHTNLQPYIVKYIWQRTS